VVLVFGAWLTFNNQMKIGELVSFILFVNILQKPIDKISAILELYPKGMAGFKRFLELLDTEPKIQDREDAIEVESLKGNIHLNDVSFSYDKNPVLKNINLSIAAGETIAFVGPSGAGKTTICSLI
ncbi:ABC transporter ATP-binding protein, partial [Bacillus paranthracis]